MSKEACSADQGFHGVVCRLVPVHRVLSTGSRKLSTQLITAWLRVSSVYNNMKVIHTCIWENPYFEFWIWLFSRLMICSVMPFLNARLGNKTGPSQTCDHDGNNQQPPRDYAARLLAGSLHELNVFSMYNIFKLWYVYWDENSLKLEEHLQKNSIVVEH
jgi:hypothetical protein